MGRFLLRPKVSYDPARSRARPWRTETECVYLTDVPDVARKLVVPRGYDTDLASVPRVPGVYWRVGNTAVLAAIVHDYLYEFDPHGWGRKVADQVFLEAMTAEEDPPAATTRWIMYRAVRMFGGPAWRRYRRSK